MRDKNHPTEKSYSYPEEQKVRKVFKLLGKLVPEFREDRTMRRTILTALTNADFYTRGQTLTIWNIYQIILREITQTAINASIRYLQNHDEEEVMDYWASTLELVINNIYRIITMSSLDSFLERFRSCYKRSNYDTF